MNVLFQRVHQLDTWAFVRLHVTGKCPYLKLVRWTSRTGDGHLYLLLGLSIWALEPQRGELFAAACAIAYLLEISLYLILKNVIRRERPAMHLVRYKPWITPSDTFSFPSGHTAAAFVFAGLVATFYGAFAPGFYVWAGLIGASRVLLGVHYPSDIAAGALLGTVCAVVGIAVTDCWWQEI